MFIVDCFFDTENVRDLPKMQNARGENLPSFIQHQGSEET
jgi:hypothetical protein